MKIQLKKIGLGLMLAVLPMMATTVSAQWTQQGQASGVVVNIGDSILEFETEKPSEKPSVTKSVHTVALTQNGMLAGQVESIDANTLSATGQPGMSVFFVQNGKVVKQAKTQNDGSFEVQGLSEGAYSFFAAGKAGFAASGVYVTKRNWGDANDILESTVASSNYSGIQKMIRQYVPIEVRNALGNSTETESNGPAFRSNNHIQLINGQLSGQISNLFGEDQHISGVQVNLVQNDQPISQVQTNSLGEFSFPDVEPGVYDFVATTNNSMVVERFEAIGDPQVITQVAYRKVITKLEFALTETQEPIPQGDGSVGILFDDAAGSTGFAGESIGFGGASGGSAGTTGNFSSFGGGGGVSSGGGRFGSGGGVGMRRLLLMGGVGGIIAISDGDATPASPVNN